MKVIVDEKKIVIEAEKDETLSLANGRNGEVFVRSIFAKDQRKNIDKNSKSVVKLV